MKSDPAGTENFALKQPRLSGKLPPAEHAKAALVAPETKVTRKPSYSGVELLTVKTRLPPKAEETSGNLPSAAALMKPGADNDGTFTTSPSSTPAPPLKLHVPLDLPPMTGSFKALNSNVVSSVPSKV